MPNNKIAPSVINDIRSGLNRGSYKIIAERVGFTRAFVSDVFCGHRYKESVILEGAKLMKEQEKEREILSQT